MTATAPVSAAALGQQIADLIAGAIGSVTTTATTSGNQVTVSKEAIKAVLAARAAAEAAEREKERVEAEFKALVGEAEEIIVDGEIVATYKKHTQNRLDQSALKAGNFAVYAQFQREVDVRPLTFKHRILARVLG
jgi:hypothetical protein